jgi:tetrahydromethanopterin S-methyltransferase subunit A
MEEKSLYSHKWKNESSYLEEPMTIPGIEKITFLTEKPVAAPHAAETLDVSVQRVNAVPAAPTQVTAEKPVKAKQAPAKITKKRVLVIIIGIVVVILLIIFLFRFYIWLNHKFLMHSINKPD